MKLFFAGATGKFWKLMAGAVQNEKADVTLLNAIEAFVKVLLPDRQAIDNRPILMLQECSQLKHPEI